jgi:hypothetical protein
MLMRFNSDRGSYPSRSWVGQKGEQQLLQKKRFRLCLNLVELKCRLASVLGSSANTRKQLPSKPLSNRIELFGRPLHISSEKGHGEFFAKLKDTQNFKMCCTQVPAVLD